jgi:hypothetical protein
MAENSFRRCVTVTSKNPYGENDEEIMFKGDKYVWCGSGVSGRTYISLYPLMINGKNEKRLIKIIPYYEDEPYDKLRFENEIQLQTMAANKGLGPKIYEYGMDINLHSQDCPFQFQAHNSSYCQFSKMNYILMEYYDKDNKWKQLKYFEIKSHENGVCLLMNQLVNEVGIINTIDPAAHIFYHPVHGYRMIDYDAAERIENKDKDKRMEELSEMLNISCKIKSSYGPARTSNIRRSERLKRTKPYGGKRTTHKRKVRHHKKTYRRYRR